MLSNKCVAKDRLRHSTRPTSSWGIKLCCVLFFNLQLKFFNAN